MAADWINSNPELKDQEEIQVGIFDYPEIPVIIDRADGIEDALKEKAPNAKVVARQSAAIADEGVTLGSQGTSYRGTVALTAETSVPAAVDVCVAASKGEEVDGNIIFDMAVITADNVADYLK